MALLGMENNKSPGNDGLTKEFYVFFWNKIKELFINFSHTGLEKQGTKHFTKAGNYKVDWKKKDRDKRFMKNWRPVSLLNIDYKTVSKTLAARLKDILPKIKSSEQSACVTNRFIGENGKLILDISKVAIFESYIVWSWKLYRCHRS